MNKERREKYHALLLALEQGLFERKDQVYKAFLATMAGESIFFLGPPGVAKSLIARRLKFAFSNSTSFEYLMNRFSTPEEIFGPISIAKLRDEDKLERKVENYLPSANIAFLDEIWKAGPSIQNTLLTIINEKIFRNGTKTLEVPLVGLIAASNELPAKNQGLEALWDRFIIRLTVDNISDANKFADMMISNIDLYKDNISDELKIELKEYPKIQNKISEIDVPSEVINVIQRIRLNIYQHNKKENLDDEDLIYVSDRRWKKIIKVLRTSAFLNGRNFVDLMDTYLIEDMIWSHPEQRAVIRSFIQDAISKFSYEISIDPAIIIDQIIDLQNEMLKEMYVLQKSEEIVYSTVQSDGQLLYEIDLSQQSQNYRRRHPWRDVSYAYFGGLEPKDVSNGTQVKFYDSNYNHLTNQNIQEFDVENETFRANLYFYLKTDYVDKEDYVVKSPHSIVKVSWDDKIDELKDSIKEIEEELDKKENNEFEHLTQNLFVDSNRANLILQNLQNSRKWLKKIDLTLDELQHEYNNVKEGNIMKKQVVDQKFEAYLNDVNPIDNIPVESHQDQSTSSDDPYEDL